MTLLDDIRTFRMDLGLMLDIDDPDSMQRTLGLEAYKAANRAGYIVS